MTNFNEVIDKLNTDYGSDMFLGRLVWYTVTAELDATHKEFHALAMQNFFDLDKQPILPGYPKTSDVFKRACTEAQRRNVPTAEPGIKNNYLTRSTGHDPKKIWRTIVRETVDSEGHTLSYVELITITFDRATENIEFQQTAGVDETDPVATEIADAIVGYVKVEGDKITAYAVREFARQYLERVLLATKVRPSGGVYFVNEANAVAVEALDKTLNGLGLGASFHYMPVLDDSKQREMLRVAFESESVGEIDRLIGEMAELMAAKQKISSNRFAGFADEYKVLRRRIAEYSDLLDEKMEATANRLEIMDTVLMELMTWVKV